ncbi:DUF4254 domain-containing protein [Nocardia cyriacigeorgica]|uniref:DUF4254 domain-containing protein n=1 Tax=Nocardia cyriacigeorgica TaxID=135487 RepID=A0A5R8P4B2_9NOCA|nr:DUF4254 domain-containing protein [Nocardia cyriacigeorgica]TLF92295.1 DUF4254 domain-containing protein [Nocardia cyriacigeorgica]
MIPLPSKDMVLEACAGIVVLEHPLLQAAYELASMHEARADSSPDCFTEIDRQRGVLMRGIDRWVAATVAPARSAAYQHTETVGAVIDRMARLSVAARGSIASGAPDAEMRRAWQQLAELTVGYSDLSYEISAGVRRLPDHTVLAFGAVE